MNAFLQDLRYALRLLAKSPGFTAVAVVTLALGIGATTAIFSVTDAVLLRPLPYDQPDRLMMLWEKHPRWGNDPMPLSPPDLADLRAQSTVFEQVASIGYSLQTLTGTGEPEQIRGARVSPNLFSVLGVRPVLGRAFLPEEDRTQASPVVVLSHGLWRLRFGSDPGVVGRAVTLSGQSRTVIGVMPEEMGFPEENTGFWAPLTLTAAQENRAFRFLRAVARLRPGVTREQAQMKVHTIALRLAQEYPKTNAGWRIEIVPLHEQVVGRVRPALLVLLGAVAFVLLIACCNLANLLLARAARRQREIVVRAALGAGRLRLVRHLLAESLLLAMVGGGLGVVLALWGVDALVAVIPPGVPRAKGIGIDSGVLAFSLLLSLAAGVLFGLAPALRASRTDLNEALKAGAGARSGEGLRGSRARSALVVSEIALAFILLSGAGLLMRSFLLQLTAPLGFNPEDVLTVQLPGLEGRPLEEALGRIQALPGVQSAGAVTTLPHMGWGFTQGFQIEGRLTANSEERTDTAWEAATPDYFRAMQIPLRQGRFFTDQDRAGAPGVAIINETMARRFFRDERPIGQRIRRGRAETAWLSIVGVVGDVRLFGIDREPRPAIYVPQFQEAFAPLSLVVRTAVPPQDLATAVRAEIRAVDRNLPVLKMATMRELFHAGAATSRFYLLLLGVFAGLALVLAAVGIYGLISYSVAQRTHEFGVRIALGAQPQDVLKLVLGQGVVLAAVGAVLGLGGAWALTRVLSGLLYRVSPVDPLTFLLVAILLALVALVACGLPAQRATRVGPMAALRYE